MYKLYDTSGAFVAQMLNTPAEGDLVGVLDDNEHYIIHSVNEDEKLAVGIRYFFGDEE